jgi:hypothetical protein
LSALALDISADFAGVATAGRGEVVAHAFALLVVWWGLRRSLSEIQKKGVIESNFPVMDLLILNLNKIRTPQEICAQNSVKKPQ